MAYDFSKVKVLVVESTKEMFDLLKTVLSLLSVPDENIYEAYTHEEGFESFCKYNQDIIITDWLDNPDHGIKLTKMIRTESCSPNVYAPIIMTAGSGHYNRVIRSRDSGVSEYLVKPFAAHALAKRITRVIENPRQYIICDSYAGPDRRVRDVEFDGPEKRSDDFQVEVEE